MKPDARLLVTQQLLAAGIAANEDEIEALIEATPARLAAIRALWAVPGMRYEEPCIRPLVGG